MRAVVDTVVFVRALISPGGTWGHLLFRLCDRYVMVLSPEIIREILEVLYRPSIRERFPQITEPQIDLVLAVLGKAEVVEPTVHLEVCRDRGDDKFFECALAGNASYIVSEDRDILDVTNFQNVQTLTAAGFTRLIE